MPELSLSPEAISSAASIKSTIPQDPDSVLRKKKEGILKGTFPQIRHSTGFIMLAYVPTLALSKSGLRV